MRNIIQQTMNSPSIKTIVVWLAENNVSEFNIDTDIFNDPYMEATTRAVEKSKKLRGSIIRPFTKCWDKKNPKEPHLYNSYFILINAGCYNLAEMLREKFKLQSDADLQNEPKHGKAIRAK